MPCFLVSGHGKPLFCVKQDRGFSTVCGMLQKKHAGFLPPKHLSLLSQIHKSVLKNLTNSSVDTALIVLYFEDKTTDF